MLRSRLLSLVVLLCLAGVVGLGMWMVQRVRDTRKPAALAAVAPPKTDFLMLPLPRPEPAAEVPAPMPEADPSAPHTPAAALQQVSFSLEGFRKSLGSNPVGSNAEIVRSLLGDNEKNLATGLPAGSQQNAAGELLDFWGTPYFFHQQSATEMTIRSAGPDRKLYTDDDLEMK